MKVLCSDYTISGSTITLVTDFSLTKESILLIADTDANEILYSFADPARGGTLVGNVLTLEYTGTLSESTRLLIYLDDGAAPANESTQATLLAVLERLDALILLMSRSAFALSMPDSSGRLRANLETSSTITTTLASGTVSTLSSLGYPTNDTIPALMRLAADNLTDKLTFSS